MSEYLYRVSYRDGVIYEGTDEEGAKLMVRLLEHKEDVKIERAELVWWPVPPEVVETGVT